MTRCICDWPSTCGGEGVVRCQGCGGDFCVCGACHGNGETECSGCEECDPFVDPDEIEDDFASAVLCEPWEGDEEFLAEMHDA